MKIRGRYEDIRRSVDYLGGLSKVLCSDVNCEGECFIHERRCKRGTISCFEYIFQWKINVPQLLHVLQPLDVTLNRKISLLMK